MQGTPEASSQAEIEESTLHLPLSIPGISAERLACVEVKTTPTPAQNL
jgi:hypothetical protein